MLKIHKIEINFLTTYSNNLKVKNVGQGHYIDQVIIWYIVITRHLPIFNYCNNEIFLMNNMLSH